MNQILEILENNAKATDKEIADMTGLKESEVKKEIKKLEKKGIIVAYKTAINWEKTDIESVHALVDVKVIPERGRGYDAIAERIYRFPEVKALYLVSGMYDLSVQVEGKTMKDVANFVSEKLAPLEQIQGTITHFLLKKYKENGIIYEETEKNKRLAISP